MTSPTRTRSQSCFKRPVRSSNWPDR